MQEKKSQLDKTIYRLYSYYNVYTDTALSEKMNISRSAISQWRYKGVIPKKILSKYDQIISGAGEKVVVAEQPIHIQKGNKQVDILHSKDSTSLDAAYIIDLQKDKIQSQEKEIASLKKELKQKNDTACNHTFENTDYDIITYQTYEIENKTPYKYFSSYEIVRWKDFCKKLGYVGQEAVELHDYIQAINSDSLDDYTGKKFNWINCQEHTAIMDHKYTEKFFKNARLKQFINAVEIHTVNYLHKDGSHIPATITVMYDMKGHSSVSKIKFLDTGN